MTNNPVDQAGGDGVYTDVAARLHATLGAPVLDPAVRQRHLQAIRDRAASLPTPAPAYAPSPAPAASGWVRRLASGVTAAGLVAVMGASGAVAASHGSLPGDTLYSVKEVTEHLVLAAYLPTGLAVDRHLTFADRRLDEAETLVDRDGDPALIAEAIAAHARLLERAGDIADDDGELASRIETANLVAHGRLAHLLDAGLPEVAANQARAALSAGQERLDRHPATPPATPPATLPARPAPPPDSAGPGASEPDAPSPTTQPDRTPAPPSPTPPSPPAQPAEPGNPAPADQPDERRPSSQSSSQPQPATPPQQRSSPDRDGAPSGPADEQGALPNRQLLPEHDRLRLGY